MARRYRTSTDYLLGLTDDPTPADKKELPEEFRELWNIYLELSPVQRKMLPIMVRILAHPEIPEDVEEQWAEQEAILDVIEAIFGEEAVIRVIDQLRAMARSPSPSATRGRTPEQLRQDAP